ncbi:farnesyl pyrophosphate synthetase, putative [Perkinsus marinus ATCC 50983]|uniref:Farnesyl pyrophosphate synthetase, putative n=1 Tax=Perkinsus marinus (strain ATCC 50983 / TXsc) TaxID=423536 RepID=C5LLX3_PERM5|nr:farnesyl pyrophosphate synthetase, putative [Perkinsus marinus ATCC 50983]EER02345.1 farnesyl pyrophosphate synthetase, putative [Perkinsus marinus ATCC 50983]|eukprot:XP_002769627.1 farnesyl pyrophosphate synthetase, putative [Perkinsus marinus ATCC 50983]
MSTTSSNEGYYPDPTKLRNDVIKAFPSFKDDILADINNRLTVSSSNTLRDSIINYFDTCIEYTTKDGGKLNRATSLVAAYDILHHHHHDDDQHDDDRDIALKLAWCVEILQSHFLTLDDVMDSSSTRRGKPCWYTKVGVSNAINDGAFLYSTIYPFIRNIASHKEWLLDVIDIFAHIEQCTLIGQHLDVNGGMQQQQQQDSEHNKEKEIERFNTIALYKTAFYTYYLPASVGVFASDDKDAVKYLPLIKDVCLKLGVYFQAQDDFLDCYASPEVLGKIGTDIEECKASWLYCTAIDVLTMDNNNKLYTLYKKDDKSVDDVERVKAIYRSSPLDMEKRFMIYEEESKKELDNIISKVNHDGVRMLLTYMLDRTYKRSN